MEKGRVVSLPSGGTNLQYSIINAYSIGICIPKEIL